MEKKIISIKKYFYRTALSIENKIKFGNYGPQFGELIYANPTEHETYLPIRRRSHSGRVLGGDWDLKPRKNIENIPRYRFCKMRWEENIPWAQTGIFDYMLNIIAKHGSVDGCFNLEDIILRYKNLDELYDYVKRTRNFRTQKELDPSAYNENGGLLFHIGRDNRPIFGGGGMHRFSMAKILKIEKIPAQLGLLHPEALYSWREHK